MIRQVRIVGWSWIAAHGRVDEKRNDQLDQESLSGKNSDSATADACPGIFKGLSSALLV
jgi:hypothetical protein